MWSMIDKEMTLKECTVYCWCPPDEPFDGEEASIWSLNYFFFNKERKRVVYLYVRGVPHSPRFRSGMAKRGVSDFESGANKRAKFWLGSQADHVTNDDADMDMWNEDDTDTYGDDFCDSYDDEADDESDGQSYKHHIRGVSEDIAARMELDV
jgi:hypothetical protein